MSSVEASFVSGVYEIRLNRPEVENAINADMFDALAALIDEIERRDDVRGVLLLGAGASFCTGADPREAGTNAFFPAPADREFLSRLFFDHWERWRLWRRFAELSKPMISAVRGRVLGEGALLAMASTWCVATPDAVFGDPAIRMGMASANPLWLWAVGPRRAREILFGKYIDGTKALQWGLVSQIAADADLENTAREAVEAIVSRPGMTGYDGQIVHAYLHRLAGEGAGIAAAQEFAQGIAAMSAIQRRGFREGEYDFWARAGQIGPDQALLEQDSRYQTAFVGG